MGMISASIPEHRNALIGWWIISFCIHGIHGRELCFHPNYIDDFRVPVGTRRVLSRNNAAVNKLGTNVMRVSGSPDTRAFRISLIYIYIYIDVTIPFLSSFSGRAEFKRLRQRRVKCMSTSSQWWRTTLVRRGSRGERKRERNTFADYFAFVARYTCAEISIRMRYAYARAWGTDNGKKHEHPSLHP